MSETRAPRGIATRRGMDRVCRATLCGPLSAGLPGGTASHPSLKPPACPCQCREQLVKRAALVFCFLSESPLRESAGRGEMLFNGGTPPRKPALLPPPRGRWNPSATSSVSNGLSAHRSHTLPGSGVFSQLEGCKSVPPERGPPQPICRRAEPGPGPAAAHLCHVRKADHTCGSHAQASR